MKTKRHFSLVDRFCLGIDQTLRALSGNVKTTDKPYPAQAIDSVELMDAERKHAAGLMRINHTGEICAQALYHGQSVGSRSDEIKEKMQAAALEEGDHLYWCQKRIEELGSHTSYLNPLWYAGSFGIGLAAGMVGDRWSLGFVAETEKQVIKHLEDHLQSLPKEDLRSHHILQQMEVDEAKHRQEAIDLGAKELPRVIQTLMHWTSRLMVKTTYWV